MLSPSLTQVTEVCAKCLTNASQPKPALHGKCTRSAPPRLPPNRSSLLLPVESTVILDDNAPKKEPMGNPRPTRTARCMTNTNTQATSISHTYFPLFQADLGCRIDDLGDSKTGGKSMKLGLRAWQKKKEQSCRMFLRCPRACI